MELKQNVDAVQVVTDLRRKAKDLREEGVLYYIADLMDNAANVIIEYVRKDIERG